MSPETSLGPNFDNARLTGLDSVQEDYSMTIHLPENLERSILAEVDSDTECQFDSKKRFAILANSEACHDGVGLASDADLPGNPTF